MNYNIEVALDAHTHTVSSLAYFPAPTICPPMKSLQSLQVKAACNPCKPMIPEQEKENPMELEIRLQRDYLLSRLNDIFQEKKDAAKRDLFFLFDDDAPKTFAEMQERIAAGKYALDEEKEKKYKSQGYGPLYFVKWRDPANKADQDGYLVWRKRAVKAYDAVKDDLRIKPVEQGLDALRAFESSTIN